MEDFTALRLTELVYLPPARVWDLLTDWAAAPAWMPGIAEMHAEEPLRVGAVLDYHSGGHERQLTVIDLDLGRAITLSTGPGDGRTDYSYSLSEDGSDTRMELVVSVPPAGPGGSPAELRHAVAAAEAGHLAAFKNFAEMAP
ncbi:SRPBCC family protein [Paeniglutamicibacter cryotolerans]|uniref:Uncharacterized protein YndB with AHSA1/START domain n=1 Tax=Paeniglutamicibacter cryotolerans TaxID=670079 RepID=A0A839QKM8_9MICC|nr:SRPBCC family protein [Paeniglutamicibacter cryotolerans]MBB2995125.1 uncharacterized protein YndB with AHSA1/START domain [Paeniglutamicibacter cryotolerans]